MKKYIAYICLLLGATLVAEETEVETEIEIVGDGIEQLGFSVSVSSEEGKVIRELLTTMGENSVFSLAFKRTYLRNLAKKLRPVNSTQFLGYVFERQDLIQYMKDIHNSSIKWKNLTRSIVRGLKKEHSDRLFDDLPSFAKFTKSNKNVLNYMAKRQDWNGFIVHLLEQN